MDTTPNFSDLWALSNKVGPKKKYASHWLILPIKNKLEIYDKVKSLDKPSLEPYLGLTLKQQKTKFSVIVSDPGDEQPGHHLWQ